MAKPVGEEETARRRFSRRALMLGLGKLAVFGALGTRLYQLQVIEEQRYALLADENRINVQLVGPVRGRIWDRFGVALATNSEGYRVVLMRSLAGGPRAIERTLAELARIIPLSPADRERIAQRALKSPPLVPVVVAPDITFEQLAAINLAAPSLPGISTETAGRRIYSHGRTMSHIVGYVGAHDRFALDDDPVLRLPGMRIGKTGVERGMERRLRGVGGSVRYEVDARGRIIRNLDQIDPQPGGDVVLTVDVGLQAEVQRRMAQEKRGAVVVLDIEGGDVLAMASVPTFDVADVMAGGAGAIPNVPAQARNWARLKTAAHDPMVDRTIRGLYPPGSTFKMVTGLAGLEAGVVTLKEQITCTGSYELSNQQFRCWRRSGHGACDFHRAIRESCDCYFYEVSRRAGIEAISGMGRKLGLGEIYPSGIGLQKPGVMPTPAWKLGRFGKPWYAGETLHAGIGQGYVLTTPMQLAVMTARLASGTAVLPSVVRRDGGPPLPAFPALDIRRQHLEAVRRAMTAVVNEEGGTGGNARFGEGRNQVAGKTGTSQVSRRSSSVSHSELKWEERDHALFVGFYPAAKPRFAVAAVIEHAGGGGANAAPLVRDVIEILTERDPLDRAVFAPAPASPASASASSPERPSARPSRRSEG